MQPVSNKLKAFYERNDEITMLSSLKAALTHVQQYELTASVGVTQLRCKETFEEAKQTAIEAYY